MKNQIPIAYSVIAGVTIIVGTDSISWEHPNRDEILKCISEHRFEDIKELMNFKEAINKFGDGKLIVVGNEVTYNGKDIDGALHERILSMMQMKLPVDPLAKFLERIQLNPSRRVIKELFNFLDKGQLPLTEDGCFLARKVVAGNFMDYHSGTVDWSPGNVVKMDRNEVDDDPQSTCSYGLHVYNRDYGKGFMRSGGKFLVVKVAPEDVVAIPYDYDGAKMRVCQAEVIQEITNEDDPEFFNSLCYTPAFDYEVDTDDDYKNYCDNCGCEISSDDILCGDCADIECPNCGEFTYDPDTSICSNCADQCENCGKELTMYELKLCSDCEDAEEEEEEAEENKAVAAYTPATCKCPVCTEAEAAEMPTTDPFDVPETNNMVKDLSEGSGEQIWIFRK